MMMFIFIYIFCNHFIKLFRKGHTQKCCSPILYLAERISRNWGDRFSSVPGSRRRGHPSGSVLCLLQPGRRPAPGNPGCSKDPSSFEGLSQHFKIIQLFFLKNIQNICLLQPGRQPAPGDPCCSKDLSSFEGLSQHFNTIQNISKHSDFWKALT